MDVNAEIAGLKRQIAGLTSSVAEARGESKAVAIAFSTMIDEVKLRDPKILEDFKKSLMRYMGPLQSGGDMSLLRALSELYRRA